MEPLKSKTYKFLKWTEQWTKTDMIYLASGGFWLVLLQIVSSGSALLLSLAFANLLPKEIYGDYKYIISLASIIGASSLSGMNMAVTQAIAKGFEGALRKSFIVQIKWGVFQVIIGIIGFFYFLNINNTVFAISFLLLGLFLPIINSTNTYLAYFNGKKNFKAVFYSTAISTLTSAAAILIAIFFWKTTLALVIAYVISNTLTNAFLYFRTLRKYKPENLESTDTIPYGKHLSLMNVSNILASNADKIIIYHFLGATNLAIYYFATAIPNQFRGIFKIIQALALPKMSQKEKTEVRGKILDKIKNVFLSTSVAIIAYIILSKYIYQYVFPQYLDSLNYSRVFSISLIFTAIAMIFISVLQSQAEVKHLYRYNIISSVFQIITIFTMTYLFGLWGAILSNIISAFFNSSFLYILIRKF